MSDDTPILSLPLIMPAQAQKHVTHNEALRLLDVLVQLVVQDRNRTIPPDTPTEGDRHIIAASAGGDWQGRDGQIAAFWGGAWLYILPQEGWSVRVLADDATLICKSGQWMQDGGALSQTDKLGINTGADDTNRLAVAAQATLLTHSGQGHQLKINKASAADTASLLFQSGWQGRAEMGLAGNDGFSIKVSPDGGQWHNAMFTDPATGETHFAQPIHLAELASDPAAPSAGMMWLNTTTGEAKVAAGGGVWPLGLGDGNRGDIAISGQGSVMTVATGAVGNGKLAPMDTGLKGRLSAGSGPVDDLTPAQARSLLDLAPLSNSDFCAMVRFGSSATMAGPFLGTAISSGTNSTAIPAASLNGTNPFGTFLRSSATANSGFRYVTAVSSDFFGPVSRKFRAKCLWRATAGNTVRLGFHNCTSATDSNNGAYFEIIADQITAKTAAASVRSVHATVLTLITDTVYTFDIEAAASPGTVRFRVWQGAAPLPVMDVTLSTNLPTSSANAFGAGVVATNSGTTASDMVILYEMAVGTIAGFRRISD